ncbi:MAG: anti-sigma factor [Ramlibacter sp.]|nr:anti-sigma factor [Ramlibacter sp.]
MPPPHTPEHPPDDDELHAFVDGRLAPWAADALRDRMADDPERRETAAAWRAQREALRAQYGGASDDPLPATFLAAAQELADGQARHSQWWRWGGIAASVMLAFVLGWVSSTAWRPGSGVRLASNGPVLQFARQAAWAHAVYLPEVRHPVEVPAAQQEHLVQWLSKRLGRPLKVPNLSAQGFELVGGRLLPGEAGARAQFMFQGTGGERITLYVGAVGTDAKAPVKETAFRFLDDGPTPGFYWVDQGFGYALSGKLPRATLLSLATAVYQQL